ncbi:sensor histidine kinase [Actinoplanes sp. DH11]|uniref:sensor histidine kinase n=1 Tax=Actinoplanes sp. DH11 TaxID=2857011 RepID=UPI001E2BE1AA|nr:sensor histidine kinase [Actinoplanes sp. DH11]
MTRPSTREVRGTLIDAAAAMLLMYLAASATLDPPGPAFTGPAWQACLAGAAVALPLVVRRRWPLPVLGFVVVAAAIATATGVVGLGVIVTTWIPVAFALYTAATATVAVPAVLALAAALGASAGTIVGLYLRTGVSSADAPNSEVPLWWQFETGAVAVVLAAAWTAGRLIRWRRAIQADLARRLARDAVAGERLRIARELHDIVGHSLSLIAVKATVANHIAEERPTETRAALVTIERTSRSALTEIRRLLDVLRADDDQAADLAPSPGTADLPGLVEPLRSAGLHVDLEVDGVDDLPPAAGLTVYRIVQESLTNVLKHAGASRCAVSVRARDGEVRIEVADDGRGRRSPGRRQGQGLIGMRERVNMYGGTLSTQDAPQGGFRVVAAMPFTADPESR